MIVRWHWLNYLKTPEAPACWLGAEKLDRYSRCLIGTYGLEIGDRFIGVMTFHPRTDR